MPTPADAADSSVASEDAGSVRSQSSANSSPDGASPTPPSHTDRPTQSQPQSQPQPQPNARGLTGWDATLDHIKRNKVDAAMFTTRLFTFIFTLLYLVGYVSPVNRYYHKALLATAATSAFRLHQRMPTIEFSRQFFDSLMKEDSAHHLYYSFIFYLGSPVTLALLPVSLYALLNIIVFVINILDKLGSHDHIKRSLSYFVEKYQQSILQTTALCEIILMPITIIGILTRVLFVFTPLLYYRFLLLRYNSRRNAYPRMLISQIKTTVGQYASRYMNR